MANRPLITPEAPLFLIGEPGTGKSAWVLSQSRDVVHINAAGREPPDMVGHYLADPQTKSTEVYLPWWWNRLNEKGKGILFIDEVTSAPEQTQAAIHTILAERCLGGVPLAEEVCIVLAGNPMDTATGGFDLGVALANRLEFYYWEPDYQEWRSGMVRSAWGKAKTEGQRYYASAVAGFISSNPRALLRVPDDPDDRRRPWASPRSWTRAALRAGRYKDAGEDVHARGWMSCFTGNVGESSAVEFSTFMKSVDAPDPEKALADPEGIDIPDDDATVIIMMGGVTEAVRREPNKERWQAALRLVVRIHDRVPDVAAATVDDFLTTTRKLRKPDWSVPRTVARMLDFHQEIRGLVEDLGIQK